MFSLFPGKEHCLLRPIALRNGPQPLNLGSVRFSGGASLHLYQDNLEEVTRFQKLVARTCRVLSDGQHIRDSTPLTALRTAKGYEAPPLRDAGC